MSPGGGSPGGGDSREDEVVDPWFGRQHTDVTEFHHGVVPSHAIQNPDAPVPNFDLCSTDVTAIYHSHPTSPPEDFNYGLVNSDITRHLQAIPPKFVNPRSQEAAYIRSHQSTSDPVAGQQHHQIFNQQSIIGPNCTEFMHPLGKHRPFPLTQLFYHDGSHPPSRSGSPCSRNQSPCSRQQSQYARPPRRQSPLGSRSRSPISSQQNAGPPRHQSPPPRSESPPRCSTPSRQRLHEYVPAAFLNCARKCQLCPPCPACQELLDLGYGNPRSIARNQNEAVLETQAVHCAGLTMGGGGVDARSHCQFHGSSPCPVQAGLPCYGMRPWSPV